VSRTPRQSRVSSAVRAMRGGSLALLALVLVASAAALTGRREAGVRRPVPTRKPSHAVPD
jgi:hypothetical protein